MTVVCITSHFWRIIITGMLAVKVSPKMRHSLAARCLSQDGLHLKRPMWFCLGRLSCCLLWRPHVAAWLIQSGGRWHGEAVAPSPSTLMTPGQLFYKTRRGFPHFLRNTNESGEKKQKHKREQQERGQTEQLSICRLVSCDDPQYFYMFSLSFLFTSFSHSLSHQCPHSHTPVPSSWLKPVLLHSSVHVFTQLSGPEGPCPDVQTLTPTPLSSSVPFTSLSQPPSLFPSLCPKNALSLDSNSKL